MPYEPPAVPANNSKATAAMIVGILSLFCCGVVLGVGAIVLGLLARNEISASGGTQGGSGMALAGIILGAVGVLSNIVLWGYLYNTNFL